MHRIDVSISTAAGCRARLAGAAALLILGLAGCGDLTAPEPTPSPLRDLELYVPYPSNASRQADAWRATRPADAAAMDRIAREPRGVWLLDDRAVAQMEATLEAAAAEGAVPLFVLYNIPRRDCAEGGAAHPGEYRDWIDGIAAALTTTAIFVLEPDALALAPCAPDPETRLDLLAYATSTITAAGGLVYIDAGHPRWLSAAVAADRLARAGVAEAEGFALNVANFVGTPENVAYGHEVSRRLGGVGFVIDTSRNGAGPAPGNEWCNPPGRKLGAEPTTNPPYEGVHALLWVKRPGESDGLCNGGPPAGEWWPEYALELAR